MKFNAKFFIRVAAVLLISVGIGTAVYAAYRSSSKADVMPVFADRTMLSGLWDSYKKEYWESATGRTLDKQQDSITTSEGQSYTMLRAVWQSDKPTFDKTWQWTQQQLQRDDSLFSWRWGKKSDGTYGILTDQNGQNTATDADTDIAMALTMAAARWQDQTYLTEAKSIINSVWRNEVITVKGTPYLVSNNLEKDDSQLSIINPSYFAPYEYRVFAKLDSDKTHDWNGLIDSSYAVLNTTIDSKLNAPSSAGLVPDWVIINRSTGEISAPTSAQGNLTTNYGYDAFRTPFRLALDYKWNNEPRAKSTLQKMSFLSDRWNDDQTIAPTYTHDGTVPSQYNYESTGAYGGDLGYFIVADPSNATEVYDKKLKALYDPNKNQWSQTLSYYDDNWAWFGVGLYTDQLDNLTKDM